MRFNSKTFSEIKHADEVLRLISLIPIGKVSTYKEVARALGNEKLARHVGAILAAHPYMGKYPCHRVVSANGHIGGYQKGIAKKVQILHNEGVHIHNNHIVDFSTVMHIFN